MPANSAAYQKTYRADHKWSLKQVSVTLWLDDHHALKSYAKSEGIGLATLLRETWLAEAQGAGRRSKHIDDDLKALKRLLWSIANNVNQMARHSNTLRQVVDDGAVLSRLRSCEELLEDFVNAKLASPWSWNLSVAKPQVLANWYDTWPDQMRTEIMTCIIISTSKIRKLLPKPLKITQPC